MGRAAWGRRPPLTRERRNPALPPGRTGRPLVAALWPLGGGPPGEPGGEAGPADGGGDGLGARSPSIPAVGAGRHHPAEKNAATGRSARRVFAVDGENGGFGPIWPDLVRNRTSSRGQYLSSKSVRQAFYTPPNGAFVRANPVFSYKSGSASDACALGRWPPANEPPVKATARDGGGRPC